MKQNKKQAKSSVVPKVIGAGIAAVVAGVAGAYFLQSAKKRKKLKGWMLKMKGEALERVENLKEVTEPMYHKTIDEAAKRFRALKNVDQEELAKMVKELKSHWRRINQKINKKRK